MITIIPGVRVFGNQSSYLEIYQEPKGCITKKMALEFGNEKYVIYPTVHGLDLESHEGSWLDDKDGTVMKPSMMD